MEVEVLNRSSADTLKNSSGDGGQQQKFGKFGIPNIHLGGSDRRLLSSTVESLLSRDEDIVLNATSFVRDVLLSDFPPETFIQESALIQSLLQVLKETWEDTLINYVAFQSLLKLANLLLRSIGYLDSNEFYQAPTEPQTSQQSNSLESEFCGNKIYTTWSASDVTESFLRNYFKFLSGLSRTLSYKSNNAYVWLLVEVYSNVIQKYLKLYNRPTITSIYLNLEEVLLDVSQTFLLNVGQVNPAIVATIMSSLLSNFDEKAHDHKQITTEIRRAIWALACNTQLSSTLYVCVRNYFIQTALPFENDLKKALDLNANDTAEMFRSVSWWKLDVINEQKATKSKNIDRISPVAYGDTLTETLFAIQNSVSHDNVISEIENLWLHLVSLARVPGRGQRSASENPLKYKWRETFFRFLSVAPTSSEDVDLLGRVLDLITLHLYLMPSSACLLDWIAPLVTEKTSPLLLLLRQESEQCIASATSPNLTTLNTSIFNFYIAIIRKGNNVNNVGEIFNVCAEALKLSYDSEFPSTAMLDILLKCLANLMATQLIQDKLRESQEVALSLLDIISNALQLLCDKTGGGSYRNIGAVQYGCVILANLSEIILKNTEVISFWVSKITSIIPHLWEIENIVVRASTLQVCANITSSKSGVLALNLQLNSPTLLWRVAYTRLTDSTEPALVKQRAAAVLLNLLKHWEQMKEMLGPELDIPRLKLLEEVQTLISNVCWHRQLSKSYRGTSDSTNIDDQYNVRFTTPSVLSLASTLIFTIVHSSSDNQMLVQENASLFKELCFSLLRAASSFDMDACAAENDPRSLQQSLVSLVNTTQTLISVVELDRTLALIPITNSQYLSGIVSYFDVSSPTDLNNMSEEVIFFLWKNIFVLLTSLLTDSGKNFEDLERFIWGHRNPIFRKLISWISAKTPSLYRRSAFDFLTVLLSSTNNNRTEQTQRSNFCQVWNTPNETYGIVICKALLQFLDYSENIEEQTLTLHCLNYLCVLSPTSKDSLLTNQIVKRVVKSLRELAIKSIDLICNNKKNVKFLDKIKWNLIILTTLFSESRVGKVEALNSYFADAIHILFKLIRNLTDPVLLQVTIECLTNYTSGFPEGSHSLTLTTGIVGVTSRKIASPNSLYVELLGILQYDLQRIDKTSNLNIRSIELLHVFVRNTTFSPECRNWVVKTKLLNFIEKLHHTEIRKWSYKYPQVKTLFLTTLRQLTMYPDMQLVVTKVPESIEILVSLLKNDENTERLAVLHILRNLSFQNGNRSRLLQEDELLRYLAGRLTESLNLEELECIGVTLWAITANSEKGKVATKQASCNSALIDAILHLRKKEHSLPANDVSMPEISNLILLLEKVSNMQPTSSYDITLLNL